MEPASKNACGSCGTQLAAGAVACFKCGRAVEVKEPTSYTAGVRPPTQIATSNNANLLDNKWLLVEKIGAGGMGTVWLAKDTVLDRKVAVKVLSESLSTVPEYIERFEREARVMAGLDHPNLITLFAVGRRGAQPYMVMKFLDGRPLSDLLRPRITPVEALPLFRQMCEGLAAMHGRSVLHRDLKPANLFVSPTGHLTILDLGIARQVGSTLTKTGIMFGTPAYMSPEQIAGEKNLDQRTDIYSAGAVLFEMITGRAPFEADEEHSLLLAHIQQPPPDASQLFADIPRPLAIAIQRALSKRPQDRFQHISEFSDAVSLALGEKPTKPNTFGGVAAPKSTKELAGPTRAGPEEPETEKGKIAPTVIRRASNPSVPRPRAPSGSNPVARSRSSPDQPKPPRSRSAPEVPAQRAPQVAPDAATPKSAPAPADLRATDKRFAIDPGEHSLAPRAALGPKLLIGGLVALFVLLSLYFMARVIAELPPEPDPKPVVILKEAVDEPKAARQVPLEAAPKLAETIRPLLGGDEGKLDPSKVGAQASVVSEAEESGEGAQAQQSLRPPRSSALRKPGGGELRLTATYRGLPVAATVFLDKRLQGKTPLFLRVSTGVYKLKVLYPNVVPVEMELLLETSKGHEFEMELDPRFLQPQPAADPRDSDRFLARQRDGDQALKRPGKADEAGGD